MKQPRTVGLALILLGTVVLLGNTTETLPPEAFFAGLVMYPLGGFLFFKGSRAAIQRAEERAAKIRAPHLRNERAEHQAAQQMRNIERNGAVDTQVRSLQSAPAAAPSAPLQSKAPDSYEIDHDLGEEDSDLAVTSDVSFPIEVQQQDSLADQIRKLQQLREDGIISDEEMATAKAKLLD